MRSFRPTFVKNFDRIKQIGNGFNSQFDIFFSSQIGDQIIELKDNADVVDPVVRPFTILELGNVGAIDNDFSFIKDVHSA